MRTVYLFATQSIDFGSTSLYRNGLRSIKWLQLQDKNSNPIFKCLMPVPTPFTASRQVILPDWIDYNGHMNVSCYVLVFDRATDDFFDFMGMTSEYRAAGNVSAFTAEMHVNYIRELKEGDKVYVTTQLLDYDAKRFHYFHRMYHAGQNYLAATSELLCLFVDMNQRRVTQMPPSFLDRLAEIKESHAKLPIPEQVGNVMRVKR